MKIVEQKLPEAFEKDIEKAVDILKKAGCEEIYIFGSLAKGNFNEESDIDFAVKGLPKGLFYKVGAELNSAMEHFFDLIKIDDPLDRFSNFIQENEVFIRVA